MTLPLLLESKLPLPLVRKGKVREVYAVNDEQLLLVTSDRVSAFDLVMRQPIPFKGAVLTQVSAYWFRLLRDVSPSHYVSSDVNGIIAAIPDLAPYCDTLALRSMLVRRTDPIPFECVVRGFLAGSAWAEYKDNGTLAGEPLPPDLIESQELVTPIFSPATKAHRGHDENVTFDTLRSSLPPGIAEELRTASLRLYERGRRAAAAQGILIADTKFEFGTDSHGELLLIDEIFTPDSSRFWDADKYQVGRSQPSFDKQPLRDYLEQLREGGAWDGLPPPPDLPPDVVASMSERYLEAYTRVTGETLAIDQ